MKTDGAGVIAVGTTGRNINLCRIVRHPGECVIIVCRYGNSAGRECVVEGDDREVYNTIGGGTAGNSRQQYPIGISVPVQHLLCPEMCKGIRCHVEYPGLGIVIIVFYTRHRQFFRAVQDRNILCFEFSPAVDPFPGNRHIQKHFVIRRRQGTGVRSEAFRMRGNILNVAGEAVLQCQIRSGSRNRSVKIAILV